MSHGTCPRDSLQRFLKLTDFDDYLEKYESFHGLETGKNTFRQEIKLLETDEKYNHREKERLLQKKKREVVRKRKAELEALRDEALEQGAWRLGIPEKVFWFSYRYPDGKSGDIIHYLAKLTGNVMELSEGHYQAEIRSGDREFLELAAFPERSCFSHYDYSGPDEIAQFLMSYHRIAELEYRMWYLNYYTQEYRNIRSIPDPVLKKLIAGYHKDIENRRNAIYEKLIVDGTTNARWGSEQKAFAIVRRHFPDAVFQYQPDWLMGQRLDIYIPERNCGIEYQGLQHTEPVAFFGGEAGLKDRMQKDKEKWIKCRLQGVRLLYWDSEKPLTEDYFLAEIYPRIMSQGTCPRDSF